MRAALFLAGCAVLVETLRVVVGPNDHVLIPGKIYRSAQPSASRLERLIRDQGLRTVVNLRGLNSGIDWFDDEAKACHDLGLVHEHLELSAIHMPSTHEMRQLLAILDRARTPLLLHCRRGADRTGLASVVALLSQTETSYAEARSKMGLRHGHWHWGPAGIMDRFFKDYETWLHDQQMTHSQDVFRRWIKDGYQGEMCQHRVLAFNALQATNRVGEPLGYTVRLLNTSPKNWEFRSLTRAGVHLGYQILGKDVDLSLEGRGGLFDRTVKPGEEIQLTLALPAFAKAGRYRLLVDLVEEGHAWFHQIGTAPVIEEIEIRE